MKKYDSLAVLVVTDTDGDEIIFHRSSSCEDEVGGFQVIILLLSSGSATDMGIVLADRSEDVACTAIGSSAVAR